MNVVARWGWLPLALCALLPRSARAQDLELYRSFSSSNLAEIGSSSGLGASARILRLGTAAVRASFHWYDESTTRTGRVCTNYAASFACAQEAVRTDTNLAGATLQAVWRHRPVSRVELEVGGGLSMNAISASDQTASGRPSDLFTYNTGHPGLLVLARTRAYPIPRLPLTLNASVANHRLILRACPTEQPAYGPYCGATDLRELRIGLGYDRGW